MLETLLLFSLLMELFPITSFPNLLLWILLLELKGQEKIGILVDTTGRDILSSLSTGSNALSRPVTSFQLSHIILRFFSILTGESWNTCYY